METRIKKNRNRGLMLVCMICVILLSTPAWADGEKIIAAIDSASPNCRGVSDKIFGGRELGQQEFKSSALLIEELQKYGFKATGELKVPADLIKDGVAKTAFRAELTGIVTGRTWVTV